MTKPDFIDICSQFVPLSHPTIGSKPRLARRTCSDSIPVFASWPAAVIACLIGCQLWREAREDG